MSIPYTRTRIRLLGPCFKTGKIELFGQTEMQCQVRLEIRSRSQPFNESQTEFLTQHEVQPNGERHRSRYPMSEDYNLQSHHMKEIQSTSLPAASCPLNPLSKVLFILPSWYLFTIGLKHVMLLGQRVPPNLRSISEEHDSPWANRLQGMTDDRRDPDPHWCSFPRDFHLHPSWHNPYSLQLRTT